MGPQTILIIRHAEKPEAGGKGGVDASGAADSRSLTPRGWVRAGAWAELLAPSLGRMPALPAPGLLYASAPTSHAGIRETGVGSRSRRPLETVTPLAEKLGLSISVDYAKGQEAALAAEVANREGTVLVCWQHEDIPAIANALEPRPHGVPGRWPNSRFNVIFRFTRRDGVSPWTFTQVVPVMLKGDLPDEIGPSA